MSKFTFDSYNFDTRSLTASFRYSFGDEHSFTEKIIFKSVKVYNQKILDRALFLAFMLIGTSYYKCFPTPEVGIKIGQLDAWQVEFFNNVYQEGMSQFAYENDLKRQDLAHFKATTQTQIEPLEYQGVGIISLQSGGKDSLLVASLLEKNNRVFTPWYISNSLNHPSVLDTFDNPVQIVRRQLDTKSIKKALSSGGKNGHVPVTYIVMSLAVIDAILTGKKDILLGIGHEGEEPHAHIGNLPVNHQWSKTWAAEQAFGEYVRKYISPDISIGSPLRGFSELKITELFVQNAWEKYGHEFSSCNLANYKQGESNQKLKWCGRCPKCANSFLLFAPFVEPIELKKLFTRQDLFTKKSLQQTFKGLLNVDNSMKPLECVGEVGELRLAYHMAQEKWGSGYAELPFKVPTSSFDYHQPYPAQMWGEKLLTID